MQSDSSAPYSAPRVPPRVTRAKATRTGGIIVSIFMALIAGFLMWLVMR